MVNVEKHVNGGGEQNDGEGYQEIPEGEMKGVHT